MTEKTPEYAKSLAKSTLFYGVSPVDLEDLITHGNILNADPNTVVVNEGDLVMGLHAIIEGSVNIIKMGKTVVATLEPGSFFGEIALFGQTISATATVGSSKGCTVLVFTRRQLEQWFQKHPYVEVAFFRNLATELCNRLSSTTEQLTAALANSGKK